MSAAGPLDGICVIDFTRVFAGPFATQILGDLGADVIKLERVDGGDEARDYGITDEMVRPGPPFLAHNRNKKSVAVDLKKDDGRKVVERLIRSADVVMHNYRPGVMERLGLGYDTVSRLNERIVYCSISGFGAHGPMRTRAANDLSIQAYSGLLSITGESGGPPVRNPASVCDLTAGLYATIGVIAALHSRSATGLGQEVSTSMLGGQLNMLNHFLVDYWMNGRVPERMGTGNALGSPNQAFPTADGHVCITSANEEMWRRCCRSLGIAELAEDSRFRTLRDRYANRNALIKCISSATSRLTTEQCLKRLKDVGVPCTPVNTIPDIAEDPLLDALGSAVEMQTEHGRPVRLVQTPLHFSATPVTARLAPPRLGEHTNEVMASAGYNDSEIERLRSSGAIA